MIVIIIMIYEILECWTPVPKSPKSSKMFESKKAIPWRWRSQLASQHIFFSPSIREEDEHISSGRPHLLLYQLYTFSRPEHFSDFRFLHIKICSSESDHLLRLLALLAL